MVMVSKVFDVLHFGVRRQQSPQLLDRPLRLQWLGSCSPSQHLVWWSRLSELCSHPPHFSATELLKRTKLVQGGMKTSVVMMERKVFDVLRFRPHRQRSPQREAQRYPVPSSSNPDPHRP